MGDAHLVSHEEKLLIVGKLDHLLDALPALHLAWGHHREHGDTLRGDVGTP